MSKKELNFQKTLIKALNKSGFYCIVNDPGYENGIPDLTVLDKSDFFKGFFVELKIDPNKLEITQKRFIEIHKPNLFVLTKSKKMYIMDIYIKGRCNFVHYSSTLPETIEEIKRIIYTW